MGPQSHRKISTTCLILVLMCTFGLQAILAGATNTPLSSSTESVEEVDGEKTKLDLDKAETKDAQKVEIIKQIQKVNNDGSYTVGYEAEDGTFKIESRDVLGNVKGTFGYVDANGEIKRVSYTANNGTGLKNVPIPESSEDVITIPRYNRSAGGPTTRRPAGYSTSSSSTPTRSTVIQSIPRRLRVLSSASSSSTERPSHREYTSISPSSSTTKSPKNDPTTTIVYATSVPTPKTYVNIRPTPLPGSNIRPAEQIARPEKLEINHVSKVQISSVRDMLTSKPVVEEVDEKDEDKKSVRGNSLRRQLMQETENNYEPRQPILYSQSAGDDAGHVYGPVSGNQRPLFTTTTTPRIPAIVLAARQRAAHIQTSITNSSPVGTEKYYIKSVRKDDESENDATTESTSERQYLTQSPIPVQIPANRYNGIQSVEETEKRVVRTQEQIPEGRYRNPQFIRVQPSNGPRLIRIPIPQNKEQIDENGQYLRETTSSSKNEQGEEQEPVPVPVRPPQQYFRSPNPQYYVVPQQNHLEGYIPQPYSAPYQVPPPALRATQNYYPDFSERPLTARDFERLLQMLIFRYQRLQGLGYNFGGLGYTPYQNPIDPYNVPVRVPIYNPYDNRPPYRGGLSVYPEPENMYQAQSPIPSQDSPMPYELQRLIPRKKQYNPRYFGGQTAGYNMDDYVGSAQIPPGPLGHSPTYLPPDIREELLYRMLMLALQTDSQHAVGSNPIVSTVAPDSDISTTTKSSITYKKPVRSVQILGEEQ